jgi:predicted AAA+ superfamily ATPase
LPDSELCSYQKIYYDDYGSSAETSNQHSVDDERLFEFFGWRKLSRIFILLGKWQHQPTHEEVDIVDHCPASLDFILVFAILKG